jgi:hypothetical protein
MGVLGAKWLKGSYVLGMGLVLEVGRLLGPLWIGTIGTIGTAIVLTVPNYPLARRLYISSR